MDLSEAMSKLDLVILDENSSLEGALDRLLNLNARQAWFYYDGLLSDFVFPTTSLSK